MTTEEALEIVDRAVLIMEAAGLHLHGRKITPMTGQAYMAAIARRKLPVRFCLKTAEWFACYAEVYPTASQFCDQLERIAASEKPPPVVADSTLCLPSAPPRPISEVRERMRKLFATGERRSEMRKLSAYMDE